MQRGPPRPRLPHAGGTGRPQSREPQDALRGGCPHPRAGFPGAQREVPGEEAEGTTGLCVACSSWRREDPTGARAVSLGPETFSPSFPSASGCTGAGLSPRTPGAPARRPLTRSGVTRGLRLQRGARGGLPGRAASLRSGARAGLGCKRAPRAPPAARGVSASRHRPRPAPRLPPCRAGPRGPGGAGGPSPGPGRWGLLFGPLCRGGPGGGRGSRRPCDPRRPRSTLAAPTPPRGLAREIPPAATNVTAASPGLPRSPPPPQPGPAPPRPLLGPPPPDPAKGRAPAPPIRSPRGRETTGGALGCGAGSAGGGGGRGRGGGKSLEGCGGRGRGGITGGAWGAGPGGKSLEGSAGRDRGRWGVSGDRAAVSVVSPKPQVLPSPR